MNKKELAEQNLRLRQALEKIANPWNWFSHEDEGGGYLCWWCVLGEPNGREIAEQALEESILVEEEK